VSTDGREGVMARFGQKHATPDEGKAYSTIDVADDQDASALAEGTAPFDVISDGFVVSTNSYNVRLLAAVSTFEATPFPIGESQALAEGIVPLGTLAAPESVVAVTSGGITLNLLFDAAAMAAPASFRAGIEQAATILGAAISDHITVNIRIDFSGTGGGAAAGPDGSFLESYSSIRADLINNATAGDTIFNALPSGSSIQGQSTVDVWNAQLKLFGLLAQTDTTTDDGSAVFATDINPNLLVGVALHELTHALGRVPNGPEPDIFDLFRFTSAGTRLFLGGNIASAAYFSLDGGNTKLADYGQTSDASDFLNSGVQGPNDPFNEFYSNNTIQQLTAADLVQLDALGFNLTNSVPLAPPVTVHLVSDTGASSSDNITFNDSLTGLGDANAVVHFAVGGKAIAGTSTANSSGTWSFTPTGLTDGTYTIVASETNAAGNTGTASLTFTLDTAAPAVTESLVQDTGASSSDKITSNPALTGSGDPNAVVHFTVDGVAIAATAAANSSGGWTFTSTGVADGTHTIVASETDVAGNTGNASLSIDLDTTPPMVTEGLSSPTSAGPNSFSDVISGTADPNAIISFAIVGSAISGTTAANANGNWTFIATDLSSGFHTAVASETDAAGNFGSTSLTFDLNATPGAVIVGTVSDDVIYALGGNATITGGPRNDTIIGGPGTNTSVYTGTSNYYTVTVTAGVPAITVQDKVGTDGTDTVTNIQHLQFNDQTLDTTWFTKAAALTTDQLVDLTEMYIAYFDRAPDALGLDFWAAALHDGTSLQQIAKLFFSAPETVAAYPAVQSTQDFVTEVYNNVLGRAPDGAGLNFWATNLQQGSVTKDVFMLDIIFGARAAAANGSAADVQYLANKELVGAHFAITQGLNDVTWAKSVMANVDGTAASVTAADHLTDGFATTAAAASSAEFVVQIIGIAL
jgi:hypothetical protein